MEVVERRGEETEVVESRGEVMEVVERRGEENEVEERRGEEVEIEERRGEELEVEERRRENVEVEERVEVLRRLCRADELLNTVEGPASSLVPLLRPEHCRELHFGFPRPVPTNEGLEDDQHRVLCAAADAAIVSDCTYLKVYQQGGQPELLCQCAASEDLHPTLPSYFTARSTMEVKHCRSCCFIAGSHLSCSLYGCKRTYSTSEALNGHLQDHHKIPAQSLPGKSFLCSTIGCEASFSSMQQLMDHGRHHHKPNYFFLCESCRAKLRSYRTLLKHLQTCAKVAKKTKVEPGAAPDADPSGIPGTPVDMEHSGPLLAPAHMEVQPSMPQPNQHVQPIPNGSSLDPISIRPTAELTAALEPPKTQNGSGQPDVSYNTFPPSLSPNYPAGLPDPSQQQEQQQWSGRISQASLSSGQPHSPPGSNAVWRKNQDPPVPLLRRWNSPPSSQAQALSREEVQWCRTRLSWSDSEWQRVIFSDESRFSLGGDDQQIHVWRHRGQHQDEQFVVTCPKGLVSLYLHPYRTICGNCVRVFKLHGQSFSSRILWEHTRGRYSCLQCGHCTPDRKEMTAHIEGQHRSPGGKSNLDT
ncbi:hypothetical protein NFI96_012184, partial [Prochilodus magdalenae]